MSGVDPILDPSAVPVSALQYWSEAFWLGPSPQNQPPELTTST